MLAVPNTISGLLALSANLPPPSSVRFASIHPSPEIEPPAFTTTSLEQGSNEDQMTEAVHVAAAIRGGASLVHGVQMRNHLQRLGM